MLGQQLHTPETKAVEMDASTKSFFKKKAFKILDAYKEAYNKAPASLWFYSPDESSMAV